MVDTRENKKQIFIFCFVEGSNTASSGHCHHEARPFLVHIEFAVPFFSSSLGESLIVIDGPVKLINI